LAQESSIKTFLTLFVSQHESTRTDHRCSMALPSTSMPAGHCDGPISAVACAPELSVIAAADTSGRLTVFDAETLSKRHQITCDAPVTCVALSVEVRAVITGEGSFAKDHFKVTVWDVDTGARRTEMWYKDLVSAVCYVPELHVVASGDGGLTEGSKSGQVVTWGVESIEKYLRLPCVGAVTSLCFAADICALAAGDRSGAVTLWDARSGAKKLEVRCGEPSDQKVALLPMALAYAQELGALICGESNFQAMQGQVVVLDAASGHRRFVLECDGAVMSIAHASERRAIVTGDRSGAVVVWDLEKRERRAELSCGASVNAVSYDWLRNRAVVGDKAGSVTAWLFP